MKFQFRARAASPPGQTLEEIFGARLRVWVDFSDPTTYTLNGSNRILTISDVRGAAYPQITPIAAEGGIVDGSYLINGHQGSSGAGGNYRITSNKVDEVATTWLAIAVLDTLTAGTQGWIFDVQTGRFLLGVDRFYNDTDGFSTSGGRAGSAGPQIVTCDMSAGAASTTRINSMLISDGSELAQYATGAWTNKGASTADLQSMSCAYDGSGGLPGILGELALVSAPNAGEAETARAALRSKWS